MNDAGQLKPAQVYQITNHLVSKDNSDPPIGAAEIIRGNGYFADEDRGDEGFLS